MGDDITYLAADCLYCAGALWGIDGRPRVYGYEHVVPADQYSGGLHTAFPADGTIREISHAEYVELSTATR